MQCKARCLRWYVDVKKYKLTFQAYKSDENLVVSGEWQSGAEGDPFSTDRIWKDHNLRVGLCEVDAIRSDIWG